MSKKKSLLTETSIVAIAVCDQCVSEIFLYLNKKIDQNNSLVKTEMSDFDKTSNELSYSLANELEEMYQASPLVQKRLKASGNKGRDHAYMYMRHNLSAKIKKHYPNLYEYVPKEFANGQKIN